MIGSKAWMILLATLALCGFHAHLHAQQSPQIVARWVGQAAKDYVGPYSDLRPNGIQDIGVSLDHLPAGRAITWAKINGEGSSEWQYNAGHGPYAIALVREGEGPRAMMFMEPDRVETGRTFFLALKFDNGQTVNIAYTGGRADPGMRMPGLTVKARFLGNTGKDLVGATTAVGPDGYQDVAIELTNLPTDTGLQRIGVRAGSTRWETGLNPEGLLNAEWVPDPADKTRATLYIQPERNLVGNIDLELLYANNGRDRVRIPVRTHSAKRPTEVPAVARLSPSRFTVQWLGQDGTSGGDRGDIHLSVAGLPRGRQVLAAGVSDAAGGFFAWRANEKVAFEFSQWDNSLKVIHDEPAGRLSLHFPVFRDEEGASMSLWLLFDGGHMTFTPFAGQKTDPFLTGQPPGDGRVTARPGDDLQALVNAHGTVELSPGVYRLTQPLVLNEPVTIVGPADAILEFAQTDGTPWAAAVKIHRGNTTLRGFTVRFATPIVWKRDDLFVPAVIGTTDRGDSGQHDPKRNITIAYMHLESPESADASKLEECPRLLHFATAQSGRIIGNVLRGGITEFVRGPWIVRDNTYLGCPEGFWVWDVFSTRWTHDVTVENNLLRPLPKSGKTWRFLVFAAYGFNNVVRNNRVENLGIRDDDTIPNPNAAEIVLTEAYTVKFEGRPAAIREEGRIVQLPLVHADAPRSGDAVAILTGKHAGEWFPIALAITPTVLLMDKPLPDGEYDISIATGFTNMVFAGNVIDSTGSSVAGNLILVGNHFGTIVRHNRLIGGGAFKLASCPTERPNIWGWTHCPYVGDVTEGNIFEDSGGAMLGVEYGKPIKSTRGRTYRAGVFRDNVFRYTRNGLDTRKLQRHDGSIVAMALSDPGGLDPGDTTVKIENVSAEFPADAREAATIQARRATVGGKALTDQWIPLPVRPIAPQPTGDNR